MKISKSYLTLGLITAAVVTLAACGGGGTAPLATTAQSITVMDGLIENALVCVDSNQNGVCEPTEAQGYTDANGNVTLQIPTADLATVKLLAVITAGLSTDADTGAITKSYSLRTPPGKLKVISPLTTMVQAKIDADAAAGTTTSVEEADSYVMVQLGLSTAKVSSFDNFVAQRGESAEHSKAGDLAHVIAVRMQQAQATETHSQADVEKELHDSRKISDDVEHLSCAIGSTNISKDCEHEIEDHVQTTVPAPQTITFASPGTQTIGVATPALIASSTSGLIVTLASTTPAVCTVSSTTLTLVAQGSCTITAAQAGNSAYAAANAVSVTFTVAPAGTTPPPAPAPVAQTITFVSPGNQTMGVATPALGASSTSGLAVTLASTTPSICTVSGTTLTLVAAGSCTVTANQAGNADYLAAAAVSRTFTVAAAPTTASAVNGKALYATNSCGSCHGTPPSSLKILNGANSPSTISSAISSVGSMSSYIGVFSPAQLADIAAYLATPTI